MLEHWRRIAGEHLYKIFIAQTLEELDANSAVVLIETPPKISIFCCLIGFAIQGIGINGVSCSNDKIRWLPARNGHHCVRNSRLHIIAGAKVAYHEEAQLTLF